MIYLASTSPRRKQLLKKAGITFRILKPDYEEKNNSKSSPSKIVRMHALEKSESCMKQIKNGTILSADTIVYFEGEIIGKPKNMKEARLILCRLQDQWHTVYTGVAILKVVSGRVAKKTVFFEKTKVHLKALTPKGIANYFKKVNPLDKAGAYAIQSPHGGIVREVRGLFSNAVGLPIEKVIKKLL
jgi:septum formation protein